MKKADPNSPRLTENDKEVLRKIIEHAKTSDSKMATEIGISPQAVFKIRTKLEQLDIIKGYAPIIDYKKIGINVMTILILRLTPEVWNKYHDDVVSERIAKIPHIVAAYRVADMQASHVLLLGFRNTEEKEKYLSSIQTKHANEIEIKDVYTFSTDKIITQSPIGLLNEIIDKRNFTDYDLFPRTKGD